jgi:hypothetical protein
MDKPKWVNDVLAQTSVKVNDVLAHPGKRCRDTCHITVGIDRKVCLISPL